jgi:hypothetical protein
MNITTWVFSQYNQSSCPNRRSSGENVEPVEQAWRENEVFPLTSWIRCKSLNSSFLTSRCYIRTPKEVNACTFFLYSSEWCCVCCICKKVASICLRKNCHVLFGSWHHVQLWGRYQSEEYILIRWFILLLCDRYVIIFGSFWLSYKDTRRYLDLIAFDFISQFLRKLKPTLMNNIQTQSVLNACIFSQWILHGFIVLWEFGVWIFF